MDKLKQAELDTIFKERWQPIKNRSESWGEEWRSRDKSIKILMETFNETLAKTEDAMISALPKFLKQTAVQRCNFGRMVVDHAEALLLEYLKTIEKKVINV